MHTEKPAGLPLESGLTPPRRILVVKQDEVLRRVDTDVLIESGYEADAARDGAVAWAALQLFDYGLLITDYDLPQRVRHRLAQQGV